MSKTMNKTMNKKTVGRIMKYIKKYIFFVILSFVCATISVITTLVGPIITGKAIDELIASGQINFDNVKKYLLWFIIAMIVTVVTQWIMNVLNNHITYSVVRDIRIEAFRVNELANMKG